MPAPVEAVSGVFPEGASILFVSDLPNETEAARGALLTGATGHEFDRWLLASRICQTCTAVPSGGDPRCFPAWSKKYLVNRSNIGITSVFNTCRPLSTFFQDDITAKGKSIVIRPEAMRHVHRLTEEIDLMKPKLIVALGAVALWALTGLSSVTKMRGSIVEGDSGYPVLPTFHPGFILRSGRTRRLGSITSIADLCKARNVMLTGELGIPERKLWTFPKLDDLPVFMEKLRAARAITIDIETHPERREITHIGFGASPYEAICVPFVLGNRAYWPTVDAEVAALKWCRAVCGLPQPKILQNGLYDAAWLWDAFRIKIVNYCEDTRLMMHALHPEFPKTLGYIGSIYANERTWKHLRSNTSKGDDA